MAETTSKVNGSWRDKVLVGDLPQEFLRMPTADEEQVSHDSEIAQQLAAQELNQHHAIRHHHQQHQVVLSDRLVISIIEAKLKKNYGMTRMDPYCRVRVNHGVYETDTSHNGAKNPTWTKPIAVPLTEPIDNIYIEVYDERSLAADSKIAWTHIILPDSVKSGEQLDDWWPLSGNLGQDMEGTIHVILSKKKVQQTFSNPAFPMVQYQSPYGLPVMGDPGSSPYYLHSAHREQQSRSRPQHEQSYAVGDPQNTASLAPLYTDADVSQINEMFPAIDDAAIRTVLDASLGNKDAAINTLLTMM